MAACVLFCIYSAAILSAFPPWSHSPFEQIGAGLRVLSLSGAAGMHRGRTLYMLLTIPLEFGDSALRKKSGTLDIALLFTRSSFRNPILIWSTGLLSNGVLRHFKKWSGSTFLFRLWVTCLSYFVSLKMQERRNRAKGFKVPSWHQSVVLCRYGIFSTELGGCFRPAKRWREIQA